MYDTFEEYLENNKHIPKEVIPHIKVVWEIQQNKVDLYRKVVKNLIPEINGEFFICGHSEQIINNLPQHIHVCPTYGADWAAIYKRQDTVIYPDVLEKINKD